MGGGTIDWLCQGDGRRGFGEDWRWRAGARGDGDGEEQRLRRQWGEQAKLFELGSFGRLSHPKPIFLADVKSMDGARLHMITPTPTPDH